MTEPPLPPLNRTAAQPRPTALTVIAIIGIVFGVLGLCSPFGAVPYFMEMPGPPNPMIEMVKESTFLFIWTIGSLFLAFVMSIVLLAGSIGALGLKPWARPTLLGYSAVSILFGLVGAVVNVVTFLPLRGDENPALAAGASFGLVGAGCGLCIGLLIQGAMIYVLMRPDVKRAFGAE
jgi:hypothetical protein